MTKKNVNDIYFDSEVNLHIICDELGTLVEYIFSINPRLLSRLAHETDEAAYESILRNIAQSS